MRYTHAAKPIFVAHYSVVNFPRGSNLLCGAQVWTLWRLAMRQEVPFNCISKLFVLNAKILYIEGWMVVSRFLFTLCTLRSSVQIALLLKQLSSPTKLTRSNQRK